MTPALNKYEVLFTSGNWNTVPTEQEQILVLVTVMEKLKYDNLKLFKSVEKSPKRKKGR